MAKTQAEAKPKQANPKQVLILAALAAVMVTVGVVQFGGLLGGGEASTPSQPQATASADAAQKAASASQDAAPTGTQLPPLSPRDPFRPNIVVSKGQESQPETNKVVRNAPSPRREIAGTPPVPPLTLPGGQIGLQPAESAPTDASEYPNYRVSGVVQGPNSVAILADSEGRRRFVKQGDLLEEGWRVVSIQRGTITLRKGKDQMTIRVGESTAPNGGNTP
ncbi:MAG: hypothetical protein KatS3mg016_2359 [Fimbriimonadales bacterium]|nr:MAG: hypothetical protein KatS3mg016_1923 [Fimbriimonadales bacterium]GIV06784.1 MAG: hypothetical protein KatS3mg016_2359 [Fimbriimonadales bacterium]